MAFLPTEKFWTTVTFVNTQLHDFFDEANAIALISSL
jgi:hypothetical protein